MNYTKNHHLPQWVESDRIRMSDFNTAMANIDSGLTGAASTASSALSASSEAKSSAAAAQSAANEAKSAAAAAQASAGNAYTPDNKPYVIGTYVGNGQKQLFDLGFYPTLVIVSGMQPSTSQTNIDSFVKYFAMSSRESTKNLSIRLEILNFGFVVYAAGNYGAILPDLSENGRTYEYIAFK